MVTTKKTGDRYRETIKQPLNGRWYDEIYKKDKDGKIYLAETTKTTKNQVTVNVTKLISGLLANESSFAGGILYHAMGAGLEAWDTSPVSAQADQETLNDELFRCVPDSILYADEDWNPLPLPPIGDITSRLIIKTTLDFETPVEANEKWIREQGLFGGTATATIETGLMINAINHPKRWKDITVKIIRYIEIEIIHPF